MSPAVLFDIGATLIEGPAQTPARFIATRFGWPDAERKRLDRRLLTSLIPDVAALTALLADEFRLDTVDAAEAAAEAWRSQVEGPRPVAGAVALLQQLRHAGARVGFVSNIWHPYFESFRRLFGPLAEGEPCCLSYRLGVAKPDPEIYRRAVAAGGAVMVGDSYDNDMQPAIAAGLRTVWLLHRQAQEAGFLAQVRAGQVPAPDVILPGIADLSPDHLIDLTRHS